jgi:hypothetical protein
MLKIRCTGPPPLGRIELSLPDGIHLCVFGESGSGRSTLCRLLAGVLLPDEGGLFLDGEPYPPPDGRRAAPVGYLPFPAPPLGRAPLIDPIIARSLDVGHLLDREGPFSVGENQLLRLGAVLSRPHAFLALDQPLVPLGAAVQERVKEILGNSACGVLLTAAEPLAGWRNMKLAGGELTELGP